MLDAYTEGSANNALSDSAKFKEGYKKKGKGKVKAPPKKVEEADAEVGKEEEEEVRSLSAFSVYMCSLRRRRPGMRTRV